MVLEGTGQTGREDPAHGDLVTLRARLWYPDVDGVLFDEAARCFEQGAYRATLVMTWLAIAEGLRHRFEVAAQRDLELTSLLEEVARREKERYAIDSFLLDKAKKHELISDHEHKDLAYIRTGGEHVLVVVDRLRHRCVEQRMPGSKQLSGYLAGPPQVLAIEADPLVP